MTFEYLDHTADVAVRLRATDFPELLGWAARALRDILLDDRSDAPVGSRSQVTVRLDAEDREALLVDFLNELIFLFDTRGFVPEGPEHVLFEGRVRFTEGGDGCRIETVLKGESFDPARHEFKTEVKAATFHDIRVRKVPGGLEADVVFDL